jgi:tight adherence protein C
MGDHIYPIWIASFLTVSLLTYGLFTYTRSRRALKDRFRKPEAQALPVLRRKDGSGPNSLKKSLLDWVSSLGRLALKDPGGIPELRNTLIQAGYRHPNAPAIYFGLRALAAFTLPLPYLMLPLLKGKTSVLTLVVAFLLALAGYFLPNYLLQVRLRQRQDRIDKALPDVLDLMIVSMEAGLSLQATLIRVAEEVRHISRDIYSEMQITNAELRTGIPRDTALKNLGERTGVQSVKSLVALMIQSDKMGSSISQALRTHADFIRVQRAQRAEEIAARLPVKILFPLMLCILPALFIVILGPAGIQIAKTL